MEPPQETIRRLLADAYRVNLYGDSQEVLCTESWAIAGFLSSARLPETSQASEVSQCTLEHIQSLVEEGVQDNLLHARLVSVGIVAQYLAPWLPLAVISEAIPLEDTDAMALIYTGVCFGLTDDIICGFVESRKDIHLRPDELETCRSVCHLAAASVDPEVMAGHWMSIWNGY